MSAIGTDYIDSNEDKKIFELPWMQWNELLRLVVERDEKLVVWTSSATFIAREQSLEPW